MFTKKVKQPGGTDQKPPDSPRGRGRPPGPTLQGLGTRHKLYGTAIDLIAANGYDRTTMRDVADALSTRALFGGGRHLVVIDEADNFISQNRPALEDYVAHARTASLLVLDARLWPATTRLYKAVAEVLIFVLRAAGKLPPG